MHRFWWKTWSHASVSFWRDKRKGQENQSILPCVQASLQAAHGLTLVLCFLASSSFGDSIVGSLTHWRKTLSWAFWLDDPMSQPHDPTKVGTIEGRVLLQRRDREGLDHRLKASPPRSQTAAEPSGMTPSTDDLPSASPRGLPPRGDEDGAPGPPPSCADAAASAPRTAPCFHPGREALAVLASRVRADVDAENAALASQNAALRPLRGLMNRVHVCCDGVQQSYVQFDAVSVEACPYW